MEAQWRLPLQHSLSESRPFFQNNDFICCKCTGSHTLYFFFAYAYYNCHLQLAQSHAHYCCRSSTTAVCQGIFTCSRLIACMKPLPPIQATFFMSTSLRVATPTNPSRYLLAYREYTLLGTWNALLTQFLSVFHSLPIRVTSGSDPDCYPDHRVIQVSSRDPVSTLTVTSFHSMHVCTQNKSPLWF